MRPQPWAVGIAGAFGSVRRKIAAQWSRAPRQSRTRRQERSASILNDNACAPTPSRRSPTEAFAQYEDPRGLHRVAGGRGVTPRLRTCHRPRWAVLPGCLPRASLLAARDGPTFRKRNLVADSETAWSSIAGRQQTAALVPESESRTSGARDDTQHRGVRHCEFEIGGKADTPIEHFRNQGQDQPQR